VTARDGDAAAAGNLVCCWGEAYIISFASGLYHAQRRDNGAQVHAPDPEQLDREIRADHAAQPVPRDLPSGTGRGASRADQKDTSPRGPAGSPLGPGRAVTGSRPGFPGKRQPDGWPIPVTGP